MSSQNYGFVRFLSEADKVASKRIILLAGDDEEVKRQALQVLMEYWRHQPLDIAHVGDIKPPKMSAILDSLSESPLIGTRRLVVVWQLAAKDVKAWAEAAAQTDHDTSCVAMPKEETDYKELPVDAVVVCDTVNAGTREFDKYLDLNLAKYGKVLTVTARAYLTEQFGRQTHSVPQELRKLALYVGAAAEISQEDAARALCTPRTQRVYELVDAVLRRDLVQALRLWNEAWRFGTEPAFFFHAIAQRVQWIEGAWRAQAINEDLKAYVKRRKIPWHLYGKLIEWLTHFRKSSIMRYTEVLCEAESRGRQGDADFHRHVVDKTIVALCA